MSVGEKLRSARLHQGLGIRELAACTKVAPKFLDAIENDRRDLIPAGFFYKHWTLQYARALGVDDQDIERAIAEILSAEAPLPLPGQEQQESKHLPHVNRTVSTRGGASRAMISFALLLIVVLGCSGFYAWWHTRQHDKSFASTTQAAQLPLVAPASQPSPAPLAKAASERVSTVASGPSVADLHAREQPSNATSPAGKLAGRVVPAPSRKHPQHRHSAEWNARHRPKRQTARAAAAARRPASYRAAR